MNGYTGRADMHGAGIDTDTVSVDARSLVQINATGGMTIRTNDLIATDAGRAVMFRALGGKERVKELALRWAARQKAQRNTNGTTNPSSNQ